MISSPIVIVGAGVAGLYAGYLLKNDSIILEATDRIGGRAGVDYFEGAKVPIGAGIGRKRDILLKRLLKELNIPYTERPFNVEYAKEFTIPMMTIFNHLKSTYKQNPSEETFKSYATKVLGKELYQYFTRATGYTDYEKEHPYNTFYNYGMEDNTSLTGFGVDWNELIVKLAQHNTIYTNTPVTKIRKSKSKWIINDRFIADKIIFAVPINALKKIINIQIPLKSQPFLRIYASLKEPDWLSAHTIVNSPLHRIIPMSNNVHMVAYTDNEDAITVNKMTKRELEEELKSAHKKATIINYKKYFWKEGTHYWTTKMTKKDVINLQIKDTCYFIGEGFSTNQGWVEGALESVMNVYSHIVHNTI